MRPVSENENIDRDRLNDWTRTTSFGGMSPRVFLQKVVRSEMGYMVAWAGHPSEQGGEREMRRRGLLVATLKRMMGAS